MTKRYEAFSDLDSEPIYSADDLQSIVAQIIKHREAKAKPDVDYFYDYRQVSYYKWNTVKRCIFW